MAGNILEETDSEVYNKFLKECESRDEKPADVLERLMLNYLDRSDLLSKVEEIHEATVHNDPPPLEETAEEIQLMDEYNPDGEEKLSYEALQQLTEIEDNIEINPNHVVQENIPQDVAVKQKLIKAIARYKYEVVRKRQVNKIADKVLDIGEGYRQRQYVDPVWNDLTVLNLNDGKVTFVSDVKSALTWMDKQLNERGKESENDIYWLSSELYYSKKDVSDEALNERLEELSLSVDQLSGRE